MQAAAASAPVRAVRPEWGERVREALPTVGKVFALWLGTRAVYAVLTYLATDLHLFPVQAGMGGGVLAWQRWDANWYVLISRLGYWTPESVNFFPLHPLLVGAITWLLGDGAGPVYPHPDPLRTLVGMAVSNLGLLAGLLAIARLAQLETDADDPDAGPRAARLVLAYPFAMAWTIGYADGLFLGLAASTLLFARRGYWWPATLTAALTGLTRPVAVILVLPLAWEFGRQQGWWRWPPSIRPLQLLRGALAIGAAPLAMAGYFAYVSLRFGDALLLFHNLGGEWSRSPKPPWWTIGHAIHRVLTLPDTSVLAVELVLMASFALIVLVSLRRIPLTYTLLVAGLLYMAVSAPVVQRTDLIWGASRYFAGAIPIYLVLARWTAGRPWLDGVLVAGGMLLQAALTIALFQGRSIF